MLHVLQGVYVPGRYYSATQVYFNLKSIFSPICDFLNVSPLEMLIDIWGEKAVHDIGLVTLSYFNSFAHLPVHLFFVIALEIRRFIRTGFEQALTENCSEDEVSAKY